KLHCLDNGGVIALGAFSDYGDDLHKNIVKINPNGTTDNSFSAAAGFNIGAQFYTFNADSNGKLYIGGKFNQYQGTSLANYLRLNSNGSLDSAFTNSVGFNNFVLSILPIDNGILLGGLFTKFNNQSYSEIIKLNY